MHTPLEKPLIKFFVLWIIMRKLAKSESEIINLSFCALPESVGGTTIGWSKIKPMSFMQITVYSSWKIFCLAYFLEGSMQENDFFY